MNDNTGKTEQIEEPFQLEVNYAYVDKDRAGRNEYFLIDVVSIDKLAGFLAILEKSDIKAIIEKICWDERQNRATQQNRRGFGNNSAK